MFGLGCQGNRCQKPFMSRLKIELRPYPLIRVQNCELISLFFFPAPTTFIFSSLSLSLKRWTTTMPPPCKRLYGHYFGESLQRLLPHFQPLSHCHFSQGVSWKRVPFFFHFVYSFLQFELLLLFGVFSNGEMAKLW